MKLQLQTEISDNDVIEAMFGLDYDDAIKLILKIDKAMADTEFTEKLIKKLLESFKPDAEFTKLTCVDWSKVKSTKKKDRK